MEPLENDIVKKLTEELIINCCAIIFPVAEMFPETKREPETPESFKDILPLRETNSLGIIILLSSLSLSGFSNKYHIIVINYSIGKLYLRFIESYIVFISVNCRGLL